jgi:hypothetical protein
MLNYIIFIIKFVLIKNIELKLSKEIKTAVLVISGILLFIFIFNYLKGENVFNSSKQISAIYENVEGLAPSAAVSHSRESPASAPAQPRARTASSLTIGETFQEICYRAGQPKIHSLEGYGVFCTFFQGFEGYLGSANPSF